MTGRKEGIYTMKKLLAAMIAIAMLLCCTAFAEDADTQVIELGTSGLAITVDASYVEGEISAEDTDESQVAYYVSDESLVDFDVYQWAKAEGEELLTIAAAEAAEYGVEEVVETNLNGIDAVYYEATEESEGVEYTTVTFIMANGDFFAEIVFWADGEGANDTIEGIINTLTVVGEAEVADEGTVLTLGTTNFVITLPVVYQMGEITAEDTDESQVGYYYSDELTVDFDVYQWAIADGEELAVIAAEEAAEYGAEAVATNINGIDVVYYEAVEESEGTEYNTVSFIMSDGENFAEIVFWADGEGAGDVIEGIINTLTIAE